MQNTMTQFTSRKDTILHDAPVRAFIRFRGESDFKLVFDHRNPKNVNKMWDYCAEKGWSWYALRSYQRFNADKFVKPIPTPKERLEQIHEGFVSEMAFNFVWYFNGKDTNVLRPDCTHEVVTLEGIKYIQVTLKRITGGNSVFLLDYNQLWGKYKTYVLRMPYQSVRIEPVDIVSEYLGDGLYRRYEPVFTGQNKMMRLQCSGYSICHKTKYKRYWFHGLTPEQCKEKLLKDFPDAT